MSTTTSSKPLFTRQQLIALLGAVSVFFVALLYLFRTQILTVMFGHIEPDVMAATNTYYLYVMASIPGIALYNGGAFSPEQLAHLHILPLCPEASYPICFGYLSRSYPWSVLSEFIRIAREQTA